MFEGLLPIVQDFRKSFLRKGKSWQYLGLGFLDGIGSQFLCLPGVLLWCLPEKVDSKNDEKINTLLDVNVFLVIT